MQRLEPDLSLHWTSRTASDRKEGRLKAGVSNVVKKSGAMAETYHPSSPGQKRRADFDLSGQTNFLGHLDQSSGSLQKSSSSVRFLGHNYWQARASWKHRGRGGDGVR